MTEPIPAAALGLFGVVAAGVTGLVTAEPAKAIAWAVSGFSNTTIWLIFAACMFADGYAKTGLGRRVALHLIRLLGGRTLGLGYAVALADLALAPFTPSNTASGGTIYPIVKNVPPLYGSLPGATAPKLGAYLLYTSLAITCVTSSMFLTGLAPNVLAVGLIGKTAGVTLSWTDWFVGFLPVGLTLFVLTPTLLFSLYPPEVKSAPEAPKWAAEELTKLGRMTAREYALLGLVLAILGLWIAGAGSVDTTMAALVGVAAMVLLGIVSWDDILANKQAWNVLVWFATLVTLAGGLAQVKFVEWVGKTLGPLFAGLPPALVIAVVVGSFFVLHYLFASVTAHDGAIAGVSHRRRRAAGAVAEGVGAHADLYVRHHGYPDAVCDGPVADLLRQRLHQGQGFLDARGDLGAAFLAALIVIGVPWLRLLGV